MSELSLDTRVRTVENKVASIETKIDMFIGEMRQQNEMRAAEIRELDTKTDARIARIESKFDEMGRHVRNLTVAAMVGMGTMTIAGIAIAISILLK